MDYLRDAFRDENSDEIDGYSSGGYSDDTDRYNSGSDDTDDDAEIRALRGENSALRGENSALRGENSALRAENARLREEINMLRVHHIMLVDQDGKEQRLSVNLSRPIGKQLGNHFVPHRQVLVFGGEPIEDTDKSFEDFGIDEGARLDVYTKRRTTVMQFMQELAEANGKDQDWVEAHMRKIEVHPQDASRIIGDLKLSDERLTTLPESIGQLQVDGFLNLSHNRLTTLPESIGQLRVGGPLALDNNWLEALPESIGKLQVGGALHLKGNRYTTVPESIGDIKVEWLWLDDVSSLPESVRVRDPPGVRFAFGFDKARRAEER